MIDFDTQYARRHESIQENLDIVRHLFEIATREGLKRISFYRREKSYFPCGLHEGIPIGLDLIRDHVKYGFPNILAKMRLLYEISEGDVDISSVYALLQGGLGIVSEDMSGGGLYRVSDNTPTRFLRMDLFNQIFFGEPKSELRKTTFWIEHGKEVRTPIVDLDHVNVSQSFKDIYIQYVSQYKKDPRFIIRPR